MKHVDVFSVQELKNNTDGFLKDAEKGILSLITKHGAPVIVAIPFDAQLLKLGVNKSLALKLYEQKLLTLSQAAKVANVSLEDFLNMLKETNISVVDYPPNDLEQDLKNIS